MLATYCVWLLFVMAVTVAMSAAFQTAVAATITIVVIPFGLMIDSVIGSFWKVTPWKLSNYGLALLTDNVVMKTYWMAFFLVIGLMIVMIIFGIVMSKKRMSMVKF